MEGVASAGVLDVSRANGILANTAASTVCITSDLPVTRPESAQSTSKQATSGPLPLLPPTRSKRSVFRSSVRWSIHVMANICRLGDAELLR